MLAHVSIFSGKKTLWAENNEIAKYFSYGHSTWFTQRFALNIRRTAMQCQIYFDFYCYLQLRMVSGLCLCWSISKICCMISIMISIMLMPIVEYFIFGIHSSTKTP